MSDERNSEQPDASSAGGSAAAVRAGGGVPWRRTLLQALALVLAAVVIGAVDAHRRPVKLADRSAPGGGATPGAQSGGATASSSGGGVAAPGAISSDISVGEARAFFEAGDSIAFADAREDEEFEAGHVQGAFHLPLSVFRKHGRPPVLDFIPTDALIVIYCNGGDCHASHDVADLLHDFGYKNLRVMKDGYPAWKAAGLPVETGKSPLTEGTPSSAAPAAGATGGAQGQPAK